MKYLLLITSTIVLLNSFTNYKAESYMSIQLKDKVLAFANAIEQRDIDQLDQLLHQDFRVVANQYPTEDKLSILSKEVYLSLISTKKIGGTKYDVKFDYISVEDHSATVVTKFQGEQSNMYLTLLLIETDNEWKIIEDMVFIK